MITVAPTGAESARSDVPALPVTLDELVRTARSCADIGASVLHLHVRDAEGRPTLDLAYLTEAVAALRESTDLVVQLAGGPVRALDADPDAASCPVSPELHTVLRDRRIVPAYRIDDLDQLATLRRLLDEYGPPYGERVHCTLVMGLPGGMPGTVPALAAALQALPPEATFTATGVGAATIPVMLAALAAGGHLRVGLEDTLAYGPGQPVRDNAQLVARAAGLARIAQRPPATPAEVRTLLGIGAA